MNNKLLSSLIAMILSVSLFAQAPQGISHQAVIRDAEGKLVTGSTIGVRVSILQGTANGTVVYSETHTPLSNVNGLISYIIGEGTGADGEFADIDWSSGPYFLKTEVDPAGGTAYSIEGTTEFQSVPYALHAASAEKAETLSDGAIAGEILYWDGHAWVAIVPGEDGDMMRFCDGVPTWGACPNLLTLQADPVAGGQVSGGGTYKPGVMVDVSATANAGWAFVNWTDGQDNEVSDQVGFTYTMPSATITLTAHFQQVSGTFTDTRDGQTYKWVKIGNQAWMAENLKYLPEVVDPASGSESTPHYYVYGYNGTDVTAAKAKANFQNYGVLYNWPAVMAEASSSIANPSGVQGVCPTGWHVPSDAQWDELVNYVVSQGYPDSNVVGGAGSALKSCRQINSPLGGACITPGHPRWDPFESHYGTDAFGFSALPGGVRGTFGSFDILGYSGYWWSATDASTTDAWARYMRYDQGSVYRYNYNKAYGFILRCVRD